MFRRALFEKLMERISAPRRHIQVLAGPRQVGKTTLALQMMKAIKIPSHYASADEPTLKAHAWIEEMWNVGRLNGLLVLDEIQKIPDWSEIVKKLWDEDTRNNNPLKVVLLGSSPLLIQHGLTESLAGRFEVMPVMHWSYSEMQKAFDFSVDDYIYYGGYPGAAELIQDPERWQRYIVDSLIETTISRDILLMSTVNKPALLRRLFHLGCHYSSQILSYQKMVGQLQDAGNTTTLAHYLELLSGAGMLTGIPKFAGQLVRQRASSPKLQVLNTALMSAQSTLSLKELKKIPEDWGHWVESAVGAYLYNSTVGTSIELFYWREGQQEVDFILRKGEKLVAIEVKSGHKKEALSGMEMFRKLYNPNKLYLVGESGISVEKFLKTRIEDLFED